MGSAVWSQNHYRFRNDDGSEASATWKTAVLSQSITAQQDVNIRVRFEIQVTGKDGSIGGRLRYSLNGGAYTEVLASSNVIRPSDSPYLTEDEATTKQLDVFNTFTAGYIDEVNGLTPSVDLPVTNVTEFEYCFQVRSADTAPGDVILLRVYNGTSALDSYPVSGQITVAAAANIASPSAGLLKITGNPPALQVTRRADPVAGLDIFYGYAPTVQVVTPALSAQPVAGVVNFTGYSPLPVVETLWVALPITGLEILAGYVPSPALTATMRPAAGLESLSGYTPSITRENATNPSIGALSVVSYAPSPALTAEARPAAGLETFAGYAPTVDAAAAANVANPSVGALVIVGYAASQEVINDLRPSSGLEAIAGYVASQEVINDLHPSAGLEIFSGYIQSAAMEGILETAPSIGVLAVSGYAPSPTLTVEARPIAGLETFSGYVQSASSEGVIAAEPSIGVLNFSSYTASLEVLNDLRPSAGLEVLTGKTPAVALEIGLTPSAGVITVVGAVHTISQIASPFDGLLEITGYEPSANVFTEEQAEPDAGSIDFAGYAPTPRLIAELVPTTGRISYTSAQQVVDHGYFTYPLACVLTVTRNTVVGSVNVDPWVPEDMAPTTGLWTPVVSVKRRNIDFR